MQRSMHCIHQAPPLRILASIDVHRAETKLPSRAVTLCRRKTINSTVLLAGKSNGNFWFIQFSTNEGLGSNQHSSGPAFRGPLTLTVSALTRSMRAATHSSASPVCKDCKPFWPLTLIQQPQAAIFIAALRRFVGPALFHGPRPSPSSGAPSWPSGLTLCSSRPEPPRIPQRPVGLSQTVSA